MSPSKLTKYCACHAKWPPNIWQKFAENSWNVISNAGPIRPWSDHKNANRNPPRKSGYFSSSPRAFSIIKYNISHPISHSNLHQILRLPRKVTLALHAVLHLPQKVTLDLHQVLHLPWKVTLELHPVLRLPRKVTRMIHPRHIWNLIYNARSNKCHPPNSPNTAPATQNDHPTSGRNLRKTAETSFPMRGRSDHDPSMIRPQKRKPQPASQVRLLFELTTSIFYCKIQHFAPNLTFKPSPNTAPATKSDTSTSPNTAPATKSDTWPSPSTAPAMKSDTWTSPNTAPATKSDTWTSPNTAPATKSDTSTSRSTAPATKNDTHWTVTLLNCDSTEPTELWLYWTVTLLNCDFTELWLYWIVTLLNCYFTELWLYWTVTLLNCDFTLLTLLNCAFILLNCNFTEMSFVYRKFLNLNFLWLYIYIYAGSRRTYSWMSQTSGYPTMLLWKNDHCHSLFDSWKMVSEKAPSIQETCNNTKKYKKSQMPAGSAILICVELVGDLAKNIQECQNSCYPPPLLVEAWTLIFQE